MRKRISWWRKTGDRAIWKIGDSEVWKIHKWQTPVEKGEKTHERRWLNRRQSCSSRRQHRSAHKRREWLHRSAQHRRSSGFYVGPKVLTYNNLHSETRAEQQTVELTTFHQEAWSGKRNERHYLKAHEFMKKKRWQRSMKNWWQWSLKNTKVTKASGGRWESGRT